MDVRSGVLAGDTRSIARAISWVENDDPRAAELIRGIYPSTGRAYIVGLTGSPGVGKSTLVSRMAALMATGKRKVGVLAVDPTSPFSGGAILGDRVRMFDVALSPNVYIRSMGTRGSLGGISRATRMASRVLDAAGFDWILVETVGAGQSEVDVHDVAYTTVVVMAPGMGDEIQAMKAGIMEIGDVFVVNKADRDGADRTAAQVASIVQLSDEREWHPPVLKVSAELNQGIERVIDAIEQHKSYLEQSGKLAEAKASMARRDVLEILRARLSEDLRHELDQPALQEKLDEVANRQSDPYTLVDTVFEQYWRKT
ncbi:MAG: methylmalonyl Co-A mutase-associated GTPase MeaB [Candidatus Cryosericum sp.]|nr:methylmalonyl Co-A mutase-associated GTPase MeaB [Candidatus Cryosericum sp.]HPS69226.1 methylmalonyl Co-A mutase-associated GTPase MeaB [Candidatus Cryosericum sp.]